MSLPNRNGPPPVYHREAGRTADFIDPAGAYILRSARAPTADPVRTYSGKRATAPAAGAYMAGTEATSFAAEMVDPAGTYSLAGVSAPTFAAAEIADAAGAYSPAGASAPTADPAGAYRGAGASAPTLAAPGAYIPVTGAPSAAAEIVDPAGAYGPAGASAATLAAAGAYVPVSGATSSAAEIANPAGAYSLTGASAPATDLSSRDSAAGVDTPTLAAPGASIPVTEATPVAAKIVAPPGTYLPPGATAAISDPGGTYTNGYNATAYTTDPAGTYSSPYSLNRLFILWKNSTPANTVLSFHSATAVANYYGATSSEASLAKEFFAVNYGETSATMLFTRVGLGQRPHLLGANIGNLTLTQLQSINGSLAINFQGYTYSGHVNLSGVTSFLDAAGKIRAALNRNLQVTSLTAGSSITPEKTVFTGYFDRAQLYVTSVLSGSIQIGGLISGHGVKPGSQIISQLSGTPGGPGHYSCFNGIGNVSTPEIITETYGVLTVGTVNSGTVALGQKVTGAGVLPQTAIDTNLSGSGPGSKWVVNNAQTVAGDITMTSTPLQVFLDWGNQPIIGATENNDFFDVSTNGAFGFDHNPSSLSYMSGTAADALGLTQASGAIDSSPGGQHPTMAQFMNDLVQNETSQFGSFQSNIPRDTQALAAWAQSIGGDGHQFLTSNFTTPPAGSTAPTIDLAGTFSPAGASAPMLAAAGTYIPGAGATSSAAELVDPAGSYSLAGASAPTLAKPGFYVPTQGASTETRDDPGYYTPFAGATAELPVQAPVISGTVAGQSTASGKSDTPFSKAKITDPNERTSDSLTIQITGGGGALADGAGFSGLTESAPGVYLLSGTAAAITRELKALVFTPNPFSARTTFSLTDTTSRGTSASDANTTVTVTNGERVYSVSYFLANQKTLDQIPGGFKILDSAANITANLNQLDDSHLHAIEISDNGNVGVSIQQLTTNATAIGKLHNANHAPVHLAITDTTADIQAELSTLVQDAGEIASISASDDPIDFSAATFLADQSALDKLVGGFDVSGTAANVVADLDQLDDPNISAITISDNGQVSVSVAQLTTDATAIGKLKNANTSPVLLAINDTAGAVQTGLSTLVQDTGEIGSITTSFGPIVVSTATFLVDQSTLDKIAEGFDVSDTAANLVAALSALNADSGVDAITADIGQATLSGGVFVNAPSFSELGWGTSLIVSQPLAYARVFSQGLGSTTTIMPGDTLSLTGTASLSGTTNGAGTLALGGGSATIDSSAIISVSNWSISGAGTDVTLDKNLSYAGSFSEGAGDTLVLSGGDLLLSGAATFARGTVDGSNILYTEGTTAVTGLTIGGTVEWENTKAVTQSGGSATIGDASGDEAILFNTLKATYDIADDSGIGRGASTASYIKNVGLFEKTGTGVSVIAPKATNTGTIEVASGTLDFKGAISGTGSDTLSGASTLEFDAKVSAGQTVSFTASGGELALHAPAAFAGSISGFDTAGAGSNDKIEVAAPWAFTGFTEKAGGTDGTLGFMNGASTIGLTLVGDYNPADFVPHTQANGSTVITYNGVSLLRPVSGAETHAGEFGIREASGSARGYWGAGASWDGSVGHGPGPS